MNRFSLVGLLLAVILPVIAVAGPPQYALVDLGVAEGGEGLPWLGQVATPAPPSYPTLGGSASIYSSNRLAQVGYSFIPETLGGGVHAVRWTTTTTRTVITDLGLLPNAGAAGRPPASFAYGLNLVGDVIGVSDTQYESAAPATTQSVSHGFLWNNGVMTDLGTIAGNGYYSTAEGVNDSREIVGSTNTISNVTGETLTRAYVYIGGTMYNLTFYLAGGPTVLLSDATAINCQGDISAIGFPATGGSGRTHSYLLVRQGAPRTNCPQ